MKKSIIKQVSLVALACLFGTTSCDSVLDINTSPNAAPVEKGRPELIFPAAVASTAGSLGSEYAVLGGIWSQYWTQSATASQYRFIDSYNVTQADLNTGFNEAFSGALNDYQFSIKKAEELKNWKFFLMATVMKAYTYQVMVDLYDQLPYSEAFQGVNNLTPKYEDGYTIYKGLLSEIDNALAKDYNAGPSVGKADVVFNGEISQWVKFANTLKLKLYLRMVYAQPAEAETGIKALFDNGANFLTSDAAFAKFEDNPDKSNPLYEFNFRKLNINTNLRASRTFLTFLEGNGDPRLPLLYTKQTGSTTVYRGLNQGDYLNQDQTLGNVSVAIVKPTDPVHFISTAEAYFLKAEALERYYSGAGAKAAYEAGVAAAFNQFGLGAQAAAFTNVGGKYEYPSAGTFEEKLEQIIEQKWASMPGAHALEGFFEKNRTGYPKTSSVYSTHESYIPGQLVYPPNGFTQSGAFPKRLVFPESERKTNPNVPALKGLTVKVWWDKK